MTTWKNTERKIAAIVGGERVPITGRQRGSAPDVAHEWLGIEVKHKANLPAWLHDAMAQAVACSDNGEKLPIVILHEKGRRHDDDFVVVKLSDFVKWFGGEDATRE